MSVNLKTFRTALLVLFAIAATAIQAQTIKGNVKDTSGEPIIGASVKEPGTKNVAVTDLDGNFSINVTNGQELQFSYIGMKAKTVKTAGKSTVNVVLEDEATSLDELVVIGYGAVRKKDLTGSVATVGNEALQAVPVATAAEALSGKMPGVNITTTEGSPDAEVTIRVRGGGSITQSNDPLYIVDGFPVESISDIPASDIEDITVLKDASSTAIYGSRGANGVILVTTKSGQAGKTKVSYNAYYSWKTIAKTLDVLSHSDYVKWQYEYAMLKNDGDPSSYEEVFGTYDDMDLYDNVASNDWQDITFGRTGHTFNHNVNVSGGSDAIRYSFSYAHMNDKAIMEGSNFKRDNFSLKLNTKPSKTTTFDLQARYSDTNIRGGGANDAESTSNTDKRLRYSVIYPAIPLSGMSGGDTTSDEEYGSLYHPLQAIADNDRKQQRKTFNMAGSFGWEIFKNFKVKAELGYDDYDNYDQRFYGLTTYYVRANIQDYPNQPAIRLISTQRHRFRSTNTVSYDFKKLFGKQSKHSLNLLAGHEYVITKKRVNTDEVHGFPTFFTSEQAWKLTSQGVPYANGGISDVYSPDDKLLSFFGRANYSFDDKYLLSATFRADASSKFSEENRWGYFPSVAVAWRISSEPFMKSTSKWLDDLKLRMSFGTAGNNNIDPGYLRQDLISRNIQYVNGYTSYFGPSSRMANPDLKWETTITRNIGLDFTLFGSKLTGSIEGYINTTKDLLMDFPMSGSYTSQYRNIGKTQNSGVELSLTYNIVNKTDWGLSLNGNISFNKNKIKSLGMDDFTTDSGFGSTDIGIDFLVEAGKSVGRIYGYVNDGRYEVSDFSGYDETQGIWILNDGVANASGPLGHNVRPGDMKLVNVDGSEDNKITASDRKVIGDTNPTATGGFGISARAYGFDLSANFNFSIGNDVYNANKIDFTTADRNSQFRNMITAMADGNRWTNIDPATGQICNDPARLAELNANTTMWSPYMNKYILTDWAVEDGSFLRLNTLTLGYTLPKSLTSRVGISSLRFYCTAYNVFCITGYSGYDPEVSTMRKNGSQLTPGVDYSAYPKSRQFVIGLNLNF